MINRLVKMMIKNFDPIAKGDKRRTQTVYSVTLEAKIKKKFGSTKQNQSLKQTNLIKYDIAESFEREKTF